jgi:2'-5' RNA ligase
MRLFLGIFPPKEILNSFSPIFSSIVKYDKYLRIVDKKNIHVSVRFLGNSISQESFSLLREAFDESIPSLPVCNIKIKEIRFGFPGRRWPRILYISIIKNEGLLLIYNTINKIIDKLDMADIYIDKHSSNPRFHITLARTKTRINQVVINNIRKTIESHELWEGFQVNTINFMESVLTKEGPEYSSIKKYKLHP